MTIANKLIVPAKLLRFLSEFSKIKGVSVEAFIADTVTRMIRADAISKRTDRGPNFTFPIFLPVGFYAKNNKLNEDNKDRSLITLQPETVALLDEAFVLYKRDVKKAVWYNERLGLPREQFERETIHFAARLAHVERYDEEAKHTSMYRYFDSFKELEQRKERRKAA